MTTVMGSRIHQLRHRQHAQACLTSIAAHNNAGSLWIVCTIGCAIARKSERMVDRGEGGEVVSLVQR